MNTHLLGITMKTPFLSFHSIMLALSIIVAHQFVYCAHGGSDNDLMLIEQSDISPAMYHPHIFELVDIVQNHILIFLSFSKCVECSLINKKFYAIITGDGKFDGLSQRQNNYALTAHKTSISSILFSKQKSLQTMLIKPYQDGNVPMWLWHEMKEVINIHHSWWPYLRETCACSFTIAKMPIITQVLKDPGRKTDEEERERWTHILRDSGDIPAFHDAFLFGILASNWFERLCELDPFLGGKISNYVDDEKIVELASFLQESCIETLTLSGLHIGEEALIRFMTLIRGSKITKIIFGKFPIVSDETRTFLKKSYPQIDWHFDDGSIGCTLWLYR